MQRKNSGSWFVVVLLGLFIALAMTGCGGEEPAVESPAPPGTQTAVTQAVEIPTPYLPPTPVPYMRDYAEARNFLVGTSFDPAYINDQELAELVIREFNVLTPEVAMKFEVIHPEQDVYDFTPGDGVVEFAEENGMLVRGHPLVWDFQLPEWVKSAYEEGEMTRDEWAALLRDHITTVVSHYRGRIYAWDVVNEAIASDGTLRDTIWLRTIGPEYIALAFRWAHEADPGALLFYNDNGGEGINPKSQAIYAMVQGLQREGVPIHGVGLQTHTWVNGPPAEGELVQNIKRLGDLGLTVHITEMDVRLQYSSLNDEAKLANQAELYERVFNVCLEAPNCEAFVVWGPTDRHSWIPGHTDSPDAPLLFDDNYQPKPAYETIMGVLQTGD